jgi:hypothetical protein
MFVIHVYTCSRCTCAGLLDGVYFGGRIVSRRGGSRPDPGKKYRNYDVY